MAGSATAARIGTRFAPVFEAWENTVEACAQTLGPVLDLIIRLWLAQIFFVSGVVKTATWASTVMLYTTEHPVPGLAPATAAVLGTGIELICAPLLAVGLFTRFAVLPLLATTLFLQLTYLELTDHSLWMVLLGLLAIRGAGALSLDHLIAPHLTGSAIPFAATLLRLFKWLQRAVLPAYLVAVRIWFGWLVMSAVTGSGGAATALTIAACALLAAGLATQFAALVLMILTLTAQAAIPELGDPVLRLFVLGFFVIHGAGALSLDRLVQTSIRALCPSLTMDPAWYADAPRVVIIGAGFGGIAAARALKHARARVTLIDRRNYHLFQPLLYQVATATLSPADIAVPIRTLVRDQRNCQVLMGRVAAIDPHRREIQFRAGSQPAVGYDYLVLATGARHSYFGKDAWEPFAPGLKKIDDATAMRSRILSAFEQAEASDDPAERQRLLTFVIVGGGPTGVELAGAIAELAHHTLREEFRSIDPAEARVVLVQSAPRILPALPESLSVSATRALEGLGVEVLLNTRVEGIDGQGATIGNERVEAGTVLWAAGVMASPAGRWIDAQCDNAGRVEVAADLSVSGLANIFAIGDTAACAGDDGRPLPGLAAVAKQQGHYVARLIRARIEGRRDPGPFRYRNLGSMATIGRKAAVAELPGMRLSGGIAWWLWGLVHVAFLVDARSRIAVMFDWFWSYLTFNRSVRLITGGEGSAD
ncbi:MAG: FAD-dependent oxidoreductase [Defluviicoccus sp.]|nr:FAD-dependent oxidoreductase [Defluviicoccus sp.]